MQMVGGKTPVNPLPTIYYLTQYGNGVMQLMNGMQQDVHELWMTLHEILNDPANEYPEVCCRSLSVTTAEIPNLESFRVCTLAFISHLISKAYSKQAV